jgi:hypothetical protein
MGYISDIIQPQVQVQYEEEELSQLRERSLSCLRLDSIYLMFFEIEVNIGQM